MTPTKELELMDKLNKIDISINRSDEQIRALVQIFKGLNIDNRFQHLEDIVLNLESRLLILERWCNEK